MDFFIQLSKSPDVSACVVYTELKLCPPIIHRRTIWTYAEFWTAHLSACACQTVLSAHFIIFEFFALIVQDPIDEAEQHENARRHAGKMLEQREREDHPHLGDGTHTFHAATADRGTRNDRS